MGLSCATQIANLFLVGLDLLVSHSLRSHIRLYTRFVDDILVIHEGCHNTIMHILNAWHAKIKVTHDDTESPYQTSFLDINVVSTGGCLHYSTYRKPLNTYCYLPFSSNHSLATKAGIINTEFRRLLVTNLHECDFIAQSQLFTRKLLDRGFPIELIRKIGARVSWILKAEILSQPCAKTRRRVVPFKITYCNNVHHLCISSSLHSLSGFLPRSYTEKYRLVTCYQSAPNLFRLRYSRFV